MRFTRTTLAIVAALSFLPARAASADELADHCHSAIYSIDVDENLADCAMICRWLPESRFAAWQTLYSDWSELEGSVVFYQNECTGEERPTVIFTGYFCPNPDGPCQARDVFNAALPVISLPPTPPKRCARMRNGQINRGE